MTAPFTDDRLDAILASIGEHLDTGSASTSITLGAPRTSSRPRTRVLAAVATVIVVVVLAITAIAPARRAVADFLRIGSTRIDRPPAGALPATGAPGASLPGLLDGLTRIDRATASARLGRAIPDTAATTVGEPDAIYATTSPDDGIILAWSTSATTLWIHRAPVDNAIIYAKQLGGTNRVEMLNGIGDSALAITGPHTLRTPDRTIAAGNVVLWIRGGVEYRLEADRPTGDLIALARAMAG